MAAQPEPSHAGTRKKITIRLKGTRLRSRRRTGHDAPKDTTPSALLCRIRQKKAGAPAGPPYQPKSSAIPKNSCLHSCTYTYAAHRGGGVFGLGLEPGGPPRPAESERQPESPRKMTDPHRPHRFSPEYGSRRSHPARVAEGMVAPDGVPRVSPWDGVRHATRGTLTKAASILAEVVTPEGFEPSIFALKGRRSRVRIPPGLPLQPVSTRL